jgi:hypothetical protein
MDWGNLISGIVGSLVGALATWAVQVLHFRRQAQLEREAKTAQDLAEQRNDLYIIARRFRHVARMAAKEVQSPNVDAQVGILELQDGSDSASACALFHTVAGQLPEVANHINDFHDICTRFKISYYKAITARRLLPGHTPEPLPELGDVEKAYDRLKEALLATGWKVPLRHPTNA